LVAHLLIQSGDSLNRDLWLGTNVYKDLINALLAEWCFKNETRILIKPHITAESSETTVYSKDLKWIFLLNVSEGLGLEPEFHFTSGVKGGRGR